jgi:DMSO/TMAO reductase YedYZ molybdopterin-dependent catalytic subunit
MSTTLFLQTRLYHSRLHGRGGLPRVHIECPTCRLAYFVDPLSGLGEERHPATAVERLREECPDHGRRLLIETHVTSVPVFLEALPQFPVPASISDVPPAWTVIVSGLVTTPLRLSPAGIEALPGSELTADFVCEEGWAVPRLRWWGVPLATVLQQATLLPDARYLGVGAGEFVAALPLATIDATSPLLAYALNGSPLPREHGGPLRLVAADTWCYQSVKWVDHIDVLSDPPLETAALFARERAARNR